MRPSCATSSAAVSACAGSGSATGSQRSRASAIASWREFSTRRAEVLRAARGPDASRAARQAATLATRRAKDYEVSPQTLRQRWAERAAEVGLDRDKIELGILGQRAQPAGTRAVLTAALMDRAVTDRASHFDRRGAVQAVAQSLPDGAPAAEVERTADAYLATEHVVRIGEGPKGERFTTRRIWELEQQALATARRMRAQKPSVAAEVPEAVRAVAELGFDEVAVEPPWDAGLVAGKEFIEAATHVVAR